jgi:hypothetical protein
MVSQRMRQSDWLSVCAAVFQKVGRVAPLSKGVPVWPWPVLNAIPEHAYRCLCSLLRERSRDRVPQSIARQWGMMRLRRSDLSLRLRGESSRVLRLFHARRCCNRSIYVFSAVHPRSMYLRDTELLKLAR